MLIVYVYPECVVPSEVPYYGELLWLLSRRR